MSKPRFLPLRKVAAEIDGGCCERCVLAFVAALRLAHLHHPGIAVIVLGPDAGDAGEPGDRAAELENFVPTDCEAEGIDVSPRKALPILGWQVSDVVRIVKSPLDIECNVAPTERVLAY